MNKDDVEQRIAALEAENAALKAGLASLEAKTATLIPKEATRPTPKPIDEGARVTYQMPTATAFVKPSEAELRQLMDITLAKFGGQAPTFESFSAAFKALGYLRRAEEPDRKHYLYHWTDAAQILLRSLSDHTELSGPAIICAALAHGDISWTDGRVDGSVFELGLKEYGGRAATDAWKKVLRGEFLPPTPVPRSRQLPPPSRVRVTTDLFGMGARHAPSIGAVGAADYRRPRFGRIFRRSPA